MVIGHGRAPPRPGDGKHPANVFCRNEVPGGAQHVGAQDAAGGELALDVGVGRSTRALGDRPFRPTVVLRLYGAERANHVGGGFGSRRREVLAGKPATKQVSPGSGKSYHSIRIMVRILTTTSDGSDAN